MGPSGSGYINSILLGLLKPQNGKITFKSKNEDIKKDPKNILDMSHKNIF